MQTPLELHPQPRIDVHLLTLDEPAEWREACIASLEGSPIKLHILPGIPGRIGEARVAGYARGTLPLVSFVDPDDRYEDSAFAQLADALDACPQAVLAATTDIHPMADWLLTRLVARRGAVLHLPIVGRHWRQHPRQVHRAADPDAVRRIRQAIGQSSNPWR